MRVLFAAATVCCVAAVVAAAASRAAPASRAPYWVFFKDRGPEARSDSALAGAAADLTPRALARRARAARERGASTEAHALVDERDLPPDPAYVAELAATGATVRHKLRWLNAASVDADEGQVDAIRALPFVEDLRPVAAGEIESTPGEEMADQFDFGPSAHQLEMLAVPEVQAMGFHGEGVLIGVLDSGFELSHEAFGQLDVVATRDFIFHDDYVGYDPRQDTPSQANHGTMVLSILAGYAPGRLVGPAFRAEFLLAKTEDNRSETPVEEDNWCAGVEWAEAMGADMVTTSLGYTKWYRPQDYDGRTGVTTRAANIAFDHGLLMVNSAGNAGPRAHTLGPPADAPGEISVGSVDWNGRISGFSSRGPTWDGRVKPDLVAMGSGTSIVIPRTRDRYGRGGGTSFAAPLVAGCAALVLGAHPEWGPEAVREALVWSGSRAAEPDPTYGWGVPNARDAILYPLIEGRITDFHTREPISGARVRWEPAGAVDSLRAAPGDAPPRGVTRTDSTGAYVVPNLPPGTFRLRVEADGYFEATTEPLEVPPNLGDVNVSLRYRGE
jgi:serine protease AprX